MDSQRSLESHVSKFEKYIRTRDKQRKAWNEKAAIAVGKHCESLRSIEALQRRNAHSKETTIKLRKKLEEFYLKHNQSKIPRLDEILNHFKGREEALCAALVVEYGEGIELPQLDEDDSTLKSKIVRSLLIEILESIWLPKHRYPFRFASSETTIAGARDIWMELLSGKVRCDFCVRTVDGANIPELCIQSVGTPIKFQARLEGLRVVDGIKTGHSIGKARPIPDSLEVDAEVTFKLIFIYTKGKWTQGQSYSFEITKLKTETSNITDQLLRSIGNVVLPTVIRRSIKKVLAPKLGRVMVHHQSLDQEQSLGMAILLELKISGWPNRGDFVTNLRTTKAASLVGKLGLQTSHVETLHQLNAFYMRANDGKTSDSGECFPVEAIDLKSLLKLHRGLYLSEYVDSEEGFEEESDAESDNDEEASMATTNSGYETDRTDDGHAHSDSEASVHSAVDSISTSGTAVAETPVVVSLPAPVIPPEYLSLIQSATVAQAEVQDRLDQICSSNGIPTWSLSKVIRGVWKRANRKRIEIEMHILAIDLRVDVNDCLSLFQEYVFTRNKSRGKEVLKRLHASFMKANLALSAITALTSKFRFSVTGALTGGPCPAFEMSVKEVASEGLLDIQLDMLRCGGNMAQLVSWIKEFLGEMRSKHVVSRLERQRSNHAISSVNGHIIDYIELVQFFLDGTLLVTPGRDGDKMILSLTAQKENPRPALSVQICENLLRILPRRANVFDPQDDVVDPQFPRWPSTQIHSLNSADIKKLLIPYSALSEVVLMNESIVSRDDYHSLLLCLTRFAMSHQDLHYETNRSEGSDDESDHHASPPQLQRKECF